MPNVQPWNIIEEVILKKQSSFPDYTNPIPIYLCNQLVLSVLCVQKLTETWLSLDYWYFFYEITQYAYITYRTLCPGKHALPELILIMCYRVKNEIVKFPRKLCSLRKARALLNGCYYCDRIYRFIFKQRALDIILFALRNPCNSETCESMWVLTVFVKTFVVILIGYIVLFSDRGHGI